MISTALGSSYRDFISLMTPKAGGRCDLVAYFFRKAFSLCRSRSAQGLIGTQTISQGDTRRGGLSAIVADGGSIFHAHTSKKWPGAAAVTVDVVHISKNLDHNSVWLNSRQCRNINPFLLPSDANDEPKKIEAEVEYFLGSKIYGQGFLFSDGDSNATPVSKMKAILRSEPESARLIHEYVGGTEVNSLGQSRRWVIDFGEMQESEARRYKALWAIVGSKLPRSRASAPKQVQSTPYWWFFNRRTEQYTHARTLSRVVVRSAISEHHAFRWYSPDAVFSHNVFVLIESSSAAFSILHSRIHEEWVNLTSSSLEDRQGYRPSDCLDTFPFPRNWRDLNYLESAGSEYSDFRLALMLRNDEGLTEIYNRFHNPDECDPEIVKLRELHTTMDRSVLDSYGWKDIPTDCEFFLKYEIDDEVWSPRKKKPWRYRWPDEVRDEVLARLLELNTTRAREETCAGATPDKKKLQRLPKKKRTKKKATATDVPQIPLWGKSDD